MARGGKQIGGDLTRRGINKGRSGRQVFTTPSGRFRLLPFGGGYRAEDVKTGKTISRRQLDKARSGGESYESLAKARRERRLAPTPRTYYEEKLTRQLRDAERMGVPMTRAEARESLRARDVLNEGMYVKHFKQNGYTHDEARELSREASRALRIPHQERTDYEKTIALQAIGAIGMDEFYIDGDLQ